MANLGKVLLVDDDEASSLLGVRLLRRMKAAEEISLAGNGHDALILLKKTAYNLVLLDLNMPVMNGLELLEALKQLQESKATAIPTIVVLTSSASAVDRKTAESYPTVKGYLSRPITEDKVNYLIRVVTEGAK